MFSCFLVFVIIFNYSVNCVLVNKNNNLSMPLFFAFLSQLYINMQYCFQVKCLKYLHPVLLCVLSYAIYAIPSHQWHLWHIIIFFNPRLFSMLYFTECSFSRHWEALTNNTTPSRTALLIITYVFSEAFAGLVTAWMLMLVTGWNLKRRRCLCV